MTIPRCGDHVRHLPSGETWFVAFADPDSGSLAPAGWPDSRAFTADCEIVYRCTDDQHRAAVDQWRNLKGHDSRRATVLRLYGGEP